MTDLRARSMRDIWALGATAGQFYTVTKTWPCDWNTELGMPDVSTSPAALAMWAEYITNQEVS